MATTTNRLYGPPALRGLPAGRVPRLRDLLVRGDFTPDGSLSNGTVRVLWGAPDGTAENLQGWPLAGQPLGVCRLVRSSLNGPWWDDNPQAFIDHFNGAMRALNVPGRPDKVYFTDGEAFNDNFLGGVNPNASAGVFQEDADAGFLGVDALVVVIRAIPQSYFADGYFALPSVEAMFSIPAGDPLGTMNADAAGLRSSLGNFRRYGIFLYTCADAPEPDFPVFGSSPPDVLFYGDVAPEFDAGVQGIAANLADVGAVYKGTISVAGGDASALINHVKQHFGIGG